MVKVVIVGAGALGKCLAVLLAGQASVTVCERDAATRRALRNGLVLKEGARRKRAKLRSIESLRELHGETINLLIFATKAMDVTAAVKEAAGLDPRCVFFPQNGIFDFLSAQKSFKNAQVCRGVTTMACQETGPNEAVLFYRGNIYVGGQGAPLVARLFRRCGVKTTAYRQPDGAVLAKLIFSAVMNPLPVLSERGYEVLRTDKKLWDLTQQAVGEGRQVAKLSGVRLAFDPSRLIKRVRNGDLAGIKHRGSIIHDRNAGRPTELDFITGALIRQAQKAGVKTPALEAIWAKAKTAGA